MNYYPHLRVLRDNSNQLFWIAKSKDGKFIRLPVKGHVECVMIKNDFLELVLEIVDLDNTDRHLNDYLNYCIKLYYIGEDCPTGRFQISESPGKHTLFHMNDSFFAMLYGRHIFSSLNPHHVDASALGSQGAAEWYQRREEEQYWSKKIWRKQTCLPDGHGTIQSPQYHELLYNKEKDIFKIVDFERSFDLIGKPMRHFSSLNARVNENGYFDYITPKDSSEPKDEPGFESLPLITCPTSKDAVKTYSEGWEPIFGKPILEVLQRYSGM